MIAILVASVAHATIHEVRPYAELARTDAELAALADRSDLPWLVRVEGPSTTDAGLGHVSRMRGVRHLWIHDSAVTDAGVRAAAKVSTLWHLTLRGAQFTDQTLGIVGEIDGLRSLTIESDGIHGGGLSHLARLTLLRSLTLRTPRLDPSTLEAVSSLENLRWLSISCDGVTDGDILPLATLDDLRHMDLSETSVRGRALAAFAGLRRLRRVDLPEASRREPAYLDGLRALPRLHHADLRGAPITMDDVAAFVRSHPELDEMPLDGILRDPTKSRFPGLFVNDYGFIPCGLPIDYVYHGGDGVVHPTTSLMDAVLRRDEERVAALLGERETGVESLAPCETIRMFHDGFDARSLRTAATPLYASCLLGAAEIVKTLLAAGADPNARAESGSAPIHAAAANGSPEIVDALLVGGADPDAAEPSGRTALMYASLYRHESIVEALLRAGADPNARSLDGESAYDIAKERGYTRLADRLRTR